MKAPLAFTLVLIGMLVLSACRSTDRPLLRKGEPMLLKLRLPADSMHWVEANSRELGRYRFMGEGVRIEGFTRFVYELRTVQRSRAGDTHFLVTPRIYEVNDQVVTPRGDRIRPPIMAGLFRDLEDAVLLHPFEFSVDAHGRVIQTRGLVELENALAGVVTRAELAFDDLEPVFRQAWQRAFMAHIDERPIRRHIHETYGFLPDGPVRLGDEWEAPESSAPWPFLPVEETTRLINRDGKYLRLRTRGEFAPPPESDWPTYKGHRTRQIALDPATGLGMEQQETVYWRRKRQRTPWEQFALLSRERSTSVRIASGPMRASPPLYAIHRYPFMEAAGERYGAGDGVD